MTHIKAEKEYLEEHSPKSNKSLWFLAGTAVGTLAMYLFDPVRGNSRRILIKDKSFKLQKESSLYLGKMWRHLRNQAQGLKANAIFSKGESVSDEILEARVRSKFGRALSHPRAIRVEASNGIVTLSGPILLKEVDEVISKIKKVHGVKEVINKMSAHERRENIPELQGRGPDYLNA